MMEDHIKKLEPGQQLQPQPWQEPSNIWKDHNITIRFKCRLLRALVISCFLNGCEIWTLTQGLEKRITAFEFCCYCRLLKIPYTVEEIRIHIGNFDQLLEVVSIRKLTWYGHMA